MAASVPTVLLRLHIESNLEADRAESYFPRNVQLDRFSDLADLSGDCKSIEAGTRGQMGEDFHNFVTQVRI